MVLSKNKYRIWTHQGEIPQRLQISYISVLRQIKIKEYTGLSITRYHKIVHAGKRTLYTWWKSMIEVAVPGTAAPVLLRNALHWPQASSGRRVGLMTRKQ